MRLEASMEYELATCVEPDTYKSGKERRRNNRKRFRTQSYIEKTLERGSMNRIVNSLN